MDDQTSLKKTDRILQILIWFGMASVAIFILDMLYLDNLLLNKLFGR